MVLEKELSRSDREGKKIVKIYNVRHEECKFSQSASSRFCMNVMSVRRGPGALPSSLAGLFVVFWQKNRILHPTGKFLPSPGKKSANALDERFTCIKMPDEADMSNLRNFLIG
jgi:hypothetical protein